MSVFDLPRLHFGGTARTSLPTGPRSGLVDLTTNTALTDSGPFPVGRPAGEYHRYLVDRGPRYDAAGLPCPDGVFSATAGWNFGGSGHFAIDATITGVEREAGRLDPDDPLVGRCVDMWGHHNEYLATTVNRARVFDVDPTAADTMTLVVGQFGFGRAGRSHDVGYAVTGQVAGTSPPRWQNPDHVTDVGEHFLAAELRRSVVYQFVVGEPRWLDGASPAVEHLKAAAGDGLVVQFALSHMSPPAAPDTPNLWRLRGTIAPWRAQEWRTHPAGRLLVPCGERTGLHTLSVDVSPTHVTFNLITAVPQPWRGGDLLLRTAESDELVATVPEKVHEHAPTNGIVTVPAASGARAADHQALRVVRLDRRGHPVELLREVELNVQSDDAALVLDHTDGTPEHDARVTFRAFLRGRPHPAAPVVRRRDDLLAIGEVDVDGTGLGGFTVRGLRAGVTRVELGPHGVVAVRVLPDDRELDDIPERDVTFELVHEKVLAYYELVSSFMRTEVFSLADRCKVETYATLMWQMCDPRNKGKTYYMPPTRDLSAPKARLLLKYLRRQQRRAPRPVAAATSWTPPITTRAELVTALRQAVTLELAVMLQYLYAAYSVPTYGVGAEWVREGRWTAEQLELACGDGGQTLHTGIRGGLLGVAREEMAHYLVVNNVLMAVGEPFHVPEVDFTTINTRLPLPVDFALEPLHLGSVQRFIAIEEPDDGRPRGGPYRSLSELYSGIRDGLTRVPDLFAVERGRGGGEHHLFLRESIDAAHPDYQFEVDDLSSALFAVDFVTEQGEGGVLPAVGDPGPSHHDTFRRIADLLMTEHLRGGGGQWHPAHPVLRNPTTGTAPGVGQPVTDPDTARVMALFNRSYHLMLLLTAQHFTERPDSSLRRSELMNAAIDVMTGMMRPLAELLVTLPSGVPGRTAGPSFELPEPPAPVSRPDVARRRIAREFADLAARCRQDDRVPDRVAGISAHLAARFGGPPR
ncbi:ferritin-like domain-containing protein [Actinosynnema sp. NPDC053489]|uniref:ferritin-like domain-containing protein n=1 Tax=Actinosynnema sp. NPDC053489 TaxID=3363916 RepID=UPI0037C842B0